MPTLLTESTSALLSPPLKWAGGKRWLVPQLRTLLQHTPYTRLVEPFCGGLAIALGLQPRQALLNDANPHLINWYRQLQAGLMTRLPFCNDEAAYYAHRQRFNQLIETEQAETPEAAALFYYLNRTGYNGLCRFNRKGLFNVPFGQYKTITYTQDFTPYQSVLAPWQFTCGDFAKMPCQPTDVLYADPPYDVPFVSYAQQGFTWTDQERLAAWLAAQPCPVIVSNQATDRILALYRAHGFTVTQLQAPRRIACTGDRTPATEMLAYKGL
jgi:DNA adenine methylase